MFRKGVQQWKLVLWPVLISLGLSSVVYIFQSDATSTVARVNGARVTVRHFSHKLSEVQKQIEQYRYLARAFGMNPADFLKMHGLQNPTEAALNKAITETVVQTALNPFAVQLDQYEVSTRLANELPDYVLDKDGQIDTNAYRRHLQNQAISDYEDIREAEMGRDLLYDVVKHASYVSQHERAAELEKRFAQKSFIVTHVTRDDVASAIDAGSLSSEKVRAYYKNHKDAYRVPEKRTISYWVIKGAAFEDDVEVREESIRRYYERNKTTLYRVKPRVKVVRLCIAKGDGASAKAEELRAQALKDKEGFKALAQSQSDQANDVERDFFERGTYDKAFERAAFLLKNESDISEVVETEHGFEVIQLVDRIKAKEKSLDDVRAEVESAVRAKKSHEMARAKLAAIKRHAGDFEKEKELLKGKADQSGQLRQITASEKQEDAIEQKVAKAGFALKKPGEMSFSSHEGGFILVSYDSIDASYVPKLDDIRDAVRADVHAAEVKDALAARGAELQRIALDGGDLRKHAGELVEDVSSRDSSTGPFSRASGLLDKAFELNHESQVLLFESGDDVFVVQLAKSAELTSKAASLSTSDIKKMIEKEEESARDTFIASLMRSATIDVRNSALRARSR